jgi:hypothetical protein
MGAIETACAQEDETTENRGDTMSDFINIPGASFYQKYEITQFIRQNGLPDTCAPDIFEALRDLIAEDKEATNHRHFTEWLEPRVHLHNKMSHGKPINKAMEREAFGINGTLKARAALREHYGDETYAIRQQAWGVSSATLTPGTDPDGISAKVLAEAEKTVKRDDDGAKSPFNPATKVANREAAIAQFISTFGTKKALEHCKRFSVDLAGRPVVYKTH